jgi:hypothetical protein
MIGFTASAAMIAARRQAARHGRLTRFDERYESPD